DGDVGVAGQAGAHVPALPATGDPDAEVERDRAGEEAVAQAGEATRLGLALADGVGERDGEGADGGGVDGPGADAPLLAAAVAGRHEPCIAPGDEGADADGSAELVGGDAHQVHT